MFITKLETLKLKSVNMKKIIEEEINQLKQTIFERNKARQNA